MIYILKNSNSKSFLLETKKENKFLDIKLFTFELKKFYKDKNLNLLNDFKFRKNGLELAKKRSLLLDQIIIKCYTFICLKLKKNLKKFNCTIVATGGYGRQELAPYSDIDLLFLHSIKSKKELEKIVKPILHILWNLGLRVGYATRTTNECIKFSKKKLDICTSILDSRFIIGNNNLFQNLNKYYKNQIINKFGKNFIKGIFTDRKKRLFKIGDTKYLLEPNIKNGKGGIRDLQTLDWIGKFFYKVRTLNDLIDKKILDKNSAKSFIEAKNFFWTVRSYLHIFSQRANEQLSFEYQTQIANSMGYKSNKALSKIEKFMKDFFYTTKKVSDLIRIYCNLIEDKEKIYFGKKQKKHVEKKIGNFVIINKRINFINNSQFKNYFFNNFEIFFQIIEFAQKKNLELHPNVSILILKNIEKIKKKISGKKFLQYFFRILTFKKNSEKFLKLMNDLGILGILIPDFKRITGQIQFTGIHTYTVDKHTLKAIGYINDFENKKNLNENKLYCNIFSEILSSRTLYIAMFFHDLGKGMGRNHSIVSAEIAEKFCTHFEIEKTEKNIVIWLIKNHLLMNDISQKRDLDDEKTIFEFSKKIESLEQLKLLFVFTVADMKATGKSIWNPWNKFPLEQLFLKTRKLLLNTSGKIKKKESIIVKSNIKKNNKFNLKIKNETFFKILPDEIYLNNEKEKIIKFLKLIKTYKNKTHIEINQNKKKLATEIIVYTKDQPGLLYKLSGAITISGFNVIEAKVSTLTNGMVLDVIYVRDLNHKMLDSLYHFPTLKENLYKVLSKEKFLKENIKKEKIKYSKNNSLNINNKVFIDNNMSDKYTIIEINTLDRIGLIYELTKKFYLLKLKISSAKILTMGYGINDIFYIQDQKGNKILSNQKIKKLKRTIISILKK